MTKREKFKYVVEILEGEIFNNTLKTAVIGKTLLEEGLCNRENILKVQKTFRKKGITVK
jgi:hypothetical protein